MGSDLNKTLYKGIKVAGTILIVLVVVYGTMRASLVVYDFGYRVFTEPAMEDKPGTAVTVTIEENMGAMDIAEYLLEKGLVRDANLFWLQYQLSAYKGEIIPGTYTLNTAQTPKEMMVVMSTEIETTVPDVEGESVEGTESTEATEVTGGTEAE